jgi:phosphate transport system substrate-binding protein
MAWGAKRGRTTRVARSLLARSLLATPLLATLTMLLVVAPASFSAAETLMVQGSTTFNRRIMEPHQAEIEAASGHTLTVIPNKSTPGLIALLEGRAQIAMISASLPGEIEALQKVMPSAPFGQLHAFEIMATRIAIGVHASNPVRQTSLVMIKQILLGKIKNWKELGGPDRPIRVVLAGGGGALAVVDSELMDGQPLNLPNAIYVKTPVQLVQVVEQEPGALGFAQLGLARERGIPEIATDRPLQTTLSLVTLGEPTPAMRSVIEAARRIVNKTM